MTQALLLDAGVVLFVTIVGTQCSTQKFQ